MENHKDQEINNYNKFPYFCICPITQEIMKDPVCIITGQSFEKEAIMEWFKRGNINNPITGLKLQTNKVIENYYLKDAIEYIKKNLILENQKKVQALIEEKNASSILEENYSNLINELVNRISTLEHQINQKNILNESSLHKNNNITDIENKDLEQNEISIL